MSSADLVHDKTECSTGGWADDGSESKKNLPVRKRKKGEAVAYDGNIPSAEEDDGDARKRGKDFDHAYPEGGEFPKAGELQVFKYPPVSKAREVRLEQNRKAARESRRRKKIMIEELQRSVIFFSRANLSLKQQNDELHRLLVQAQVQVQTIEQGGAPSSDAAAAQPTEAVTLAVPSDGQGANLSAVSAQQVGVAAAGQFQFQNMAQAQAQAAQAAATQALYESQGFPPGAAHAAAQTLVGGQSSDASASGGAPPIPNGTEPAAIPAYQVPQAAAVAANPFMAAMMGMGAPAGVPTAAAQTSGAPAPATGATPNYMDAFNQFALQQQWFAAQLGAMGAAPAAIPGMAAVNPAHFQQMQIANPWCFPVASAAFSVPSPQ